METKSAPTFGYLPRYEYIHTRRKQDEQEEQRRRRRQREAGERAGEGDQNKRNIIPTKLRSMRRIEMILSEEELFPFPLPRLFTNSEEISP